MYSRGRGTGISAGGACSSSGITGYIVQENDSLWDIAKNYFLTPQQIMEMNNLPREEVKKGDRLILMKRVVIN